VTAFIHSAIATLGQFRIGFLANSAEDYNQGLMRVTTDDDAMICAAAILSLYGSDRVGPEIVAAKAVTVTNSENGWLCSLFRENAFRSEVVTQQVEAAATR